ncbi:MAG TPA: hypothetical protein VKT70_05580 [Stellaceae bacterium]|nr:hypothetical protein [Stellaceae bacterium]
MIAAKSLAGALLVCLALGALAPAAFADDDRRDRERGREREERVRHDRDDRRWDRDHHPSYYAAPGYVAAPPPVIYAPPPPPPVVYAEPPPFGLNLNFRIR